MGKLRLVVAQLNLRVGDLAGNLTQHLRAARFARDSLKADIIVFPELSITGYPPEDLLLRRDFLTAVEQTVNTFITQMPDIYCVIGYPQPSAQGLTNLAALSYNGKIILRYAKQYLPNYAVFDEQRYFVAGNQAAVIELNKIAVGIVICEDLWHNQPVAQAAQLGAQVILVLNASPFALDKQQLRIQLLQERARTHQVAMVYVNHCGAQDELSFDGGSMVVDQHGQLQHVVGFNAPTLHPVDLVLTKQQLTINQLPYCIPSQLAQIYQQLVQGVRDYITKNNLPGAIVGISGGIDSALTLAIAVDALGSKMVEAVFMPSLYTAPMSQIAAVELTKNCAIPMRTIAIHPIYHLLHTSLGYAATAPVDLSLENLQARCRGIILMNLANQSGKIVLVTANHSELAVGYGTMYGDLAGGFAVLKDVPKTLVYQLVAYRNRLSYIIPQLSITRPPSAELAPGQLDSDHLPDYAILDQIIALYLRHEYSAAEIVAQGFAAAQVQQVLALIKNNEYKRRQLAPGIRLTDKAFGKDRRYPITSGF